MSFSGLQRAVDLRLGDLPRDRPQDEDAADAGIGVELADQGEHIGLLDVPRQRFRDVAAAELPGDATEAALVGVGGVVVAGQDRREAGFRLRSRARAASSSSAFARSSSGEPVSVDDDRHVGRNIRPPHQPGPDRSGPYTRDGRTANVGAGPVRPRWTPAAALRTGRPSSRRRRCRRCGRRESPRARHRLHVAAEGDDPAGARVGA